MDNKANIQDNQTHEMAERCRELLDIQDDIAAEVVVKTPSLTGTDVSDCLAAGRPLLTFDDFFPDWEQFERALRRITGWLARYQEKPLSLDIGPAIYRESGLAWYDGKPGTSGELVAIVGASLRPFLQARSRILMPMVDQSHWRRRQCPVCGGSPDFSYLAKEDGARWLICSRCDGAWLFERLACPRCCTQEQTKLAYLTDDTERYRLYVCDACRTYIKAIDLRQTQDNVRLPLERVLTLHFDQQASLNGYQPIPSARIPV